MGDGSRREAVEALGAAMTVFRRLLQLPQVSAYWRRRLVSDVDVAHYRVLYAIASAGDQPNVCEVSAALDVEVSTASRQLDRAIAAGLVDRRRSAGDGRRRELTLTDAGRRCLVELREAREALLGELTAGLEAAEIVTAARVLEHMHERARALRPEPVAG